MLKDTIRADAADTMFVERELLQKKAQAYEKKYPQLKGRLFVPLGTNYDPAVEIIVYEMYDQVGMAKVITNYANDFPRAEVSGIEYPAKVKSLGDSFGYSVMDVRRARMAGRPLESRKSNAARRAMLEKEEVITALGDADHKLVGLLNNENVPTITAVDIDVTGAVVTEWAHKTAAQILVDLNLFESTIQTNTKGTESPDTLLLPPGELTRIRQMRLDDSDMTVLEWFLSKSQSIRNVDSWHFLDTAGLKADEVTACQRAMAYRRDIDYVEHPLPQDFEYPVPLALKGMEYEQICHERTGGVIMRYPLGSLYMDGI